MARPAGRRGAEFERLESRALLSVSTPPTVSIADATIAEGNSGTRTLSFVVSLSEAAPQPASVRFETVDGTATTAGGDYASASGTVSFRTGQRTAMVSVAVRGDVAVEDDETFQVVLSSPTAAVLGRATATAVILDDDGAARTVSVAGPAAAVNEGAPAVFTFALSRPSLLPVSVSYATSDLTASSGSDYAAASGSLTFAAGETTKTVSVTTQADSVVEADEAFTMRIAGVTGASTGSPASATATIKDVPPVVPPTVNGAWTILVYMTGENLNPDARGDINEMEKALVTLPGSVKIVVSWDQPKSSVGSAYSTGGGTQAAWRTYGRSVLKADSNTTSTTSIASTFDLSFGEKNTGDPATLVDFVKWGVQKAPAQNYLLQMWGHGGGLAGSQFDSESGSDALTIGEIATALAAPGMPAISLVSYDNCLMAMAEVGAAIAPSVGGLYVASEELVNGTGQDYTTAYAALKATDPATVTAAQVAAGMISSYGIQYQGDAGRCDTFSAVAASGYPTLTAALRQFVDATVSLGTTERTALRTAATASVAYDTTPFRDLGGFMTRVAATTTLPQALRSAATAVQAAVSAMVVSKTADQRSSSGMSIYLPTSSTDAYLATYATTAATFCQATGWNTFAKWLATGTRSIAPSGAPARARAAIAGEGSRNSPDAGLGPLAWAAFANAAASTSDHAVSKPRPRWQPAT